MREPRRGWSWDTQREVIYGVIAVMMGLSLGVGLHAVASATAAAGGSTREGVAVFALIVGALLLLFGDALLARRHTYAALLLFPLALVAGFGLLGRL